MSQPPQENAPTLRTSMKCSGCSRVWYCTKMCQSATWSLRSRAPTRWRCSICTRILCIHHRGVRVKTLYRWYMHGVLVGEIKKTHKGLLVDLRGKCYTWFPELARGAWFTSSAGGCCSAGGGSGGADDGGALSVGHGGSAGDANEGVPEAAPHTGSPSKSNGAIRWCFAGRTIARERVVGVRLVVRICSWPV